MTHDHADHAHADHEPDHHGHDHHAHDHHGNADHGHPPTAFQPDIREPEAEWEVLEIALRELLIEKGVVTAAEIAAKVEEWEGKSPEAGGRLVARAWADPAFKARLLEDGNAAAGEMGLGLPGLKLVVLENTGRVHHVVVCTLCSCYPRAILGIPPLWYKSRAYRSRTVREPRAVLAEFGTHLADNVEVRVVDATADCRFLVLPKRPEETEGWSEERLATLVTRDSMIGTAMALRADGVRA